MWVVVEKAVGAFEFFPSSNDHSDRVVRARLHVGELAQLLDCIGQRVDGSHKPPLRAHASHPDLVAEALRSNQQGSTVEPPASEKRTLAFILSYECFQPLQYGIFCGRHGSSGVSDEFDT